MNYGDLKTAVLADAHRPDLTAHVARFIREGEGMIRRDLRSYPLSATLDETDRVSEGVYTLPAHVLELRVVRYDDCPLEQVGLAAIRRLPDTLRPKQYAVIGSTIEVRGVPGADAELELEYLGHPDALAADGDENDLLTDHETLYIEAALFFLFKHTQDVELAQGALDTFNATIEKLNEQLGRKLGGASIAPAYNFNRRGGY